MDFKNFCIEETEHINHLKQYKNILEKFHDAQIQPQYHIHRQEKESIQKSFYGNPDEFHMKDFEKFKSPAYNTYEPYEDKYEIHTYCDKCDGRLSTEYLGDNKFKSKKTAPIKKAIPEHLMGRVIRQKSSPKIDEPDHAEEPKILYKITIKTNEDQSSGTSSSLSIRLVENTKKQEPIILDKKRGSLKFYFAPGSTEVFYVKCIAFNVLKYVIIELNAKDDNDEWFGDWISIEELSGQNRKWFCKLNRWLSCKRDKCELFAKLKPEANMVPVIPYKIKVYAANDSVDNFVGVLSIQLLGSERKSEMKQLLINERPKTIKKGSTTIFELKSQDVGQLKAIRVTVEETMNTSETPRGWNEKLDNKRKSVSAMDDKVNGWKDIKIDKISIHWKGRDKKVYDIEFQMNDWIGLSHKMKKKSVMLKDPVDINKRSEKLSKSQEKSTYDITFSTGKKTFSGTDSTVSVKLYGSYGIWSKTYDFEDFDKKKFESGKEDTFRISGPSVGSIQKINISHGNTGIAPGWKLEKVNVVRLLSSSEICSALEDLKQKCSLPKEIKFEDGKVKRNMDEKTIKESSSPDHNSMKSSNDKHAKERIQNANIDENFSDLSSLSDSETNKRPLSNSRTNDNDNDNLLLIQLPYAEESVFLCRKWVSKTDSPKSDGVTMDAETKTILFSPISMLLNPDN